MAIHPDGYPAADPRDDEPTAGDVTDIYCSSCEREIADEVAKMAENHVPDVMDAES